MEGTAPGVVTHVRESSRTTVRGNRGSDSGSALVSRHAATRHYARNVPADFSAFVEKTKARLIAAGFNESPAYHVQLLAQY